MRGSQDSFDFGSTSGGGRVADVLFFAIRPPPDEVAALADLGRRLVRASSLKATAVAAQRLHISLVGWRPDSAAGVDVAREIGRRIVWPAFDVVLSAAMSFGRSGSRPLVLGCSPGAAWALTGLHDRLLETAALCGVGLRGRAAFEPHLTLAYSQSAIAERLLRAPIRWRASELMLIRSERGRGRHTELGRWPFRAMPSQG
ncbi:MULTISPECIES: 2'-5' RNA ligase family protein [Phenylobacterium]|uniref:2'-5' RNA ligase n=1 Tax=Phenylobacterium koreense TaxID=266125 RepID=A0ABV2ELT8_9CAUL